MRIFYNRAIIENDQDKHQIYDNWFTSGSATFLSDDEIRWLLSHVVGLWAKFGGLPIIYFDNVDDAFLYKMTWLEK